MRVQGCPVGTAGLAIVGLAACRSPGSADSATTFRGPPLSFEANRGQTDPRVSFVARGDGHAVFLTAREAVLVLTQGDSGGLVLRMRFVGGNPRVRAAGVEELPGKANYLVGNDPTKWRTNVPLYARVLYAGLYRGIDLAYAGDQRQVVYEFVVHPEADPSRISLSWQGADSLDVDAQGDLVLHTETGVVRQRKALIYQWLDGTRHEVAGGYLRRPEHSVAFQVAAYDTTRPLVITAVLPLSITPMTR